MSMSLLTFSPTINIFHFKGFSATDGVRVYNLPTDMTQTSSELTHAFGQRTYRIATGNVFFILVFFFFF